MTLGRTERPRGKHALLKDSLRANLPVMVDFLSQFDASSAAQDVLKES